VSIQKYTRLAVFLADHSRLELIFPSLVATAAYSQVHSNQFNFMRQPLFSHSENSGGQAGDGLTLSPAGGRIISTMSDLAAKTCVPCRGGVPPLKGKELSLLQKQVDAWIIIEEHHITKTFKFPHFR